MTEPAKASTSVGSTIMKDIIERMLKEEKLSSCKFE